MALTKFDIDLLRCKYDPVYFITKHCKTAERREGRLIPMPFPKYEYLLELLKHMHRSQNNLIEKSRQMTVSWATQAYNVWGLLFGEGYVSLNLSRNENLVDNGSVSSLFGKIRYILNHISPEILEHTMGEVQGTNQIVRFCRATNKKKGNSIEGQSSASDSGRGGTYTKVFADEFGFMPNDHEIFAAFDEACPDGKNLITTPPLIGRQCKFYQLREGAPGNGFELITIHWTRHPFRDGDWYKKACDGKTKDEIARELDIDWFVSVKGRIYHAWDESKYKRTWEYNPDLPLDIDFDFGIGESPVSIGISQDLPTGETVYLADAEYHSKTVEEVVPRLRQLISTIGAGHEIKPESCRCFGDPAGKARGATGASWISEFSDHGFDIEFTTDGQKRDLHYGHLLVQRMVEAGQLIVAPTCKITIDGLMNYRYKTDRAGEVLSEMKPVDDQYKHRMDGLRYKTINTRVGNFDYTEFAQEYKDTLRSVGW